MVRKTKESGVPTRDKLSKALALVQSLDPANLSLKTPTNEQQSGENRKAPGSRDNSFLYNAFSSRAASSGPGKPSSTKGKQHKKMDNFASNLYHTINNQNQPSSSENQPRSGSPSKPLTPRAAAAAAAKKSREHSEGSGSSSAMSPRSAVAAAYVSEKRKVRRDHEQQHPQHLYSKKSIEQALVTVSSQGAVSQGGVSTDSGTSGRRKHSNMGRYHREWNSKSHQDDMEAALKVSTDIEKDIQATSQTLAQINQFIDTVKSSPSKKKDKQSKDKRNNNNSFVQVYQRNRGDASVDIDSCAAIAEEEEEEEHRETRDPEATWSGRETASEREESPPHHNPSTNSGWDATASLYGAERHQQPDGGRIYIADDSQDFDSLATYTSKPAESVMEPSRQSPAVSVFAASVKTKEHEKEKEAVYYTVKQEKSSGFDALLLHAVSSNSSDKPIAATATATRQIPIQVGSPANQQANKSDAEEGANKSKTSQERRDERSAASAPSKASGKSEDPPDSADVQTMGSNDELLEKTWGVDDTRSLDSLDDDDEFGSIGTPNDPHILSEISAFIDRVEQKNKGGKSKKGSTDSVQESSSAYDFDAATLSSMFDGPIAPRSGRAGHSKGDSKVDGQESQSVGTFPTLSSVQSGKGPSWQDMERMLNSSTKNQDTSPSNDKAASARDSGSAKDIAIKPSSDSMARSKEEDPICLVRGDHLPEANAKRRLQLDPSTEVGKPFHMMSNDSTPTNKPRTAVKRGADPPPFGEDKAEVRSKKDPPAEDVSFSGDRTHSAANRPGQPKEPSRTHKASPQAHEKQLSPRHRGGPPRPEGPTLASKGVNPKSLPSTDVEVINVGGTDSTLASKEIEVIHVDEESSAEAISYKKKALRVDTTGPGTEATPIMVVSPTDTGFAEAAASVFVDLTEVYSGEMPEENTEEKAEATVESHQKFEAGKQVSTPSAKDLQSEEDYVKAWMNADINCMSEDQALKELLSMAEESPRKTPRSGARVLNIGFSADSDDGAGAPDEDDLAYDGESDASNKGAYIKRNFKDDGQPKSELPPTPKVSHCSTIKEEGSSHSSRNPPGESDASKKSAYTRRNFNDDDDEQPKSELPPTPKVSHRTIKEESSSHSSRNPPGEYAGSRQRDDMNVRQPDQGESENDREALLKTVIGSHPGDIVSEGEDDKDPLQSLLFAQKNNASELASERKAAGMSLIRLTLDEVKNFVDSNLLESGGISNQRIKELEQLDERVPSLLTDLGDDGLSDDDTSSESDKPTGGSTETKTAYESQQASNEDQSMPVTYDFQPASKQPDAVVDVDSGSQSTAGQLSESSSKSKKGLKRKLLADNDRERQISNSTETPTNWLSSLDRIFACKRPNSSKCGGASASQTGTTPNDKHAFSSNPSDEATDDGIHERLIEGTPQNSDQVEIVNTRFSFSSERQDRSSRKRKEGVSDKVTSEEVVVPDDDSWDDIHPSQERQEAVSSDIGKNEKTDIPDDDSCDAKKEDSPPSPQREGHQGISVNEEIIISDEDSWDAKKDSPQCSPREGQESKSVDGDAESKEIVVSDDSYTDGKEEDTVEASALPSGIPTDKNVSKQPDAQDNFNSGNQEQQQFTNDGVSSEVDENQDETLRSEDLEDLPILVNSSEEETDSEGENDALDSPEHLPITANERQKGETDSLEKKQDEMVAHERKHIVPHPDKAGDEVAQKGKQVDPPSEERKQSTPHTVEMTDERKHHAPHPEEAKDEVAHKGKQDAPPSKERKHATPHPDKTRNEMAHERIQAPDPSEAHPSDIEVDTAEPASSEDKSPPSSLAPGGDYEDFEDKPCVSDLLQFTSQSEASDGDLEAAIEKALPPRDTQLPSYLKVESGNTSVDESTEDGRNDTDQKPALAENQERLIADLTHQEDGKEDVNEHANAWEELLDLGSLQEESDLGSWENPTYTVNTTQQESNQAHESGLEAMSTQGKVTTSSTPRDDATPRMRHTQEKVTTSTTPRDDATPRMRHTQEKVTTSTTPRDDATPRMHQSKRFDFIEDVDEDENIDAYLSRMTNLKRGGHLPDYNIKPLGSYAEKEGHEEDTDNVEVDFDVGFVKKSLAPVPNQDHNSWDEDDELAKHNNRYVSMEESSDDEDDQPDAKLKVRLDTIADGDEEDGTSLGSSTRTSFVPSSTTKGSTFDDRDDESIGSVKNPIVVDSTSLNEMDDQFPVDDSLHHGIEDGDIAIQAFQSVSYESDNDEWLRKRDLATRKTQNPKSWLTRTASGIQSKLSFISIEAPKPINGVAAAKKILSRTVKRRGGRRRNPIPPTNVWRLSYKERTREHTGYFNVDVFSLFDSSAVGVQQTHHLDAAPWESRDVRQHFLQESSIGFSKNWFGKAQRCRGNDRVKERVAHPKSMEMPMESKPHHEEWTEEWYKPWEAPPDRDASRSVTSSYTGTGSGSATDDASDTGTGTAGPEDHTPSSSYNDSASYSTSDNFTSGGETDMDDRSYYYEDTPQCGELINVKPKIGERVSRIHPDYTSQLRRSRWRKKYFPRGSFPYK